MSEKIVRTYVFQNENELGEEFLDINDVLDPYFDVDDKVVVILESEYDRLKRLGERNRRLIDAIDNPD